MEELKKRLEVQIERLTDKIYDGEPEVYTRKQVVKMLREVRTVVRETSYSALRGAHNESAFELRPNGGVDPDRSRR